MMTVCSSTPVLTNDVSSVFVNVLTGDESSEMLPTSGLFRGDVALDTQKSTCTVVCKSFHNIRSVR